MRPENQDSKLDRIKRSPILPLIFSWM